MLARSQAATSKSKEEQAPDFAADNKEGRTNTNQRARQKSGSTELCRQPANAVFFRCLLSSSLVNTFLLDPPVFRPSIHPSKGARLFRFIYQFYMNKMNKEDAMGQLGAAVLFISHFTGSY